MAAESAFAVNVREAEPYVRALRDRFDPAAKLGVPAHITVLYPFMSPDQIGAAVLEKVRRALSCTCQFTFRLGKVQRFPAALYLAPEPSRPFVELTRKLVAEFPAYLPYGGQYGNVVPHLTVAQGEYPNEQIERQLREALPTGGIEAFCREVALIENSSGLWKPMQFFALPASNRPNRGG